MVFTVHKFYDKFYNSPYFHIPILQSYIILYSHFFHPEYVCNYTSIRHLWTFSLPFHVFYFFEHISCSVSNNLSITIFDFKLSPYCGLFTICPTSVLKTVTTVDHNQPAQAGQKFQRERQAAKRGTASQI